MRRSKVTTDPMFDPGPPVMRPEKPKGPRSVKWAFCPNHIDIKKTGLVIQGEHLAWRDHNRVTWSGVKLPCPASGRRLRDCPTKHGDDRCRCVTTPVNETSNVIPFDRKGR